MDSNNNTLLTCGDIDNPDERNNKNIRIQEVVIAQGERLLGVNSEGRGLKCAYHYDM